MKQLKVCHCVKCENDWHSCLEHPVACPRCKRRDWDGVHDYRGRVIVAAAAVYCRCGKCGNEWKQRQASKKPKECPRCKRRDWEAAPVQALCFMCNGRGCSVCRPPAAVSCVWCHDRGMVAARGGCPECGRVYQVVS
jgi:hypothetical protein